MFEFTEKNSLTFPFFSLFFLAEKDNLKEGNHALNIYRRKTSVKNVSYLIFSLFSGKSTIFLIARLCVNFYEEDV
jgi:hypothetical protein